MLMRNEGLRRGSALDVGVGRRVCFYLCGDDKQYRLMHEGGHESGNGNELIWKYVVFPKSAFDYYYCAYTIYDR